MNGIDTSLEEDQDISDFVNENPMPNIWTIEDEVEIDSSVDNHQQSEKEEPNEEPRTDEDNDPGIVSSKLDDDLEKPSFLRRLAKRHVREDGQNEEQKK